MSQQHYTDVDKIHLEEQFREVRRRVTLANVTFFVFFFASFFLLIYIKDEGFLKGLVIFWLLVGLALIRFNRKTWRCPACSRRWELQQLFASAYWDYCPQCAAPLRRAPRVPHHVNLNENQIRELQEKFKRNRWWGNIALALLVPLLIVVLVVLDAKGFSDSELKLIGIIFGGVFTSIYFSLSRCVNCKRGLILGCASHCYLCGVKLK
jgi:uncharacterized protein with PIN domain